MLNVKPVQVLPKLSAAIAMTLKIGYWLARNVNVKMDTTKIKASYSNATVCLV